MMAKKCKLKNGFRVDLESSRLSYSDSPLFSPVTTLAINLQDLNASFEGSTPKRRISWSSASPSSLSHTRQQLCLDDDANACFPSSQPTSPIVTRENLMQNAGVESPIRLPDDTISEQAIHGSKKILQKTDGKTNQGLSPLSTLEKENFPRFNFSWRSPMKDKLDIEDMDSSSRDSGFYEKDEKPAFRFTAPKGLPPRRQQSCSEHQLSSSAGCTSSSSSSSSALMDLESSDNVCEDSLDDGFHVSSELNLLDKQTNLPNGIKDLLEGDLQFLVGDLFDTSKSRWPLKEIDDSRTNDNESKVKGCSRGLFGVSLSKAGTCCATKRPGFKRSEPPNDCPAARNKRHRSLSLCCQNDTVVEIPKTVYRCFSEKEVTIMKAVQRSDQEPNLIGDFTKQYILPLVPGKHQDLKCISHMTVKELLVGEFDDLVEKCVVVDCRYPYEFEAGHIKGAINIYTKESVLREFLVSPMVVLNENKRLVIVFHCEFSSERGPNLTRFLRSKDRETNKDCYPHLHYPEIYLLEGGYKDFFENHSNLCEPPDYKPMLHKDHEQDLKHFRAKSKSWNSGDKTVRFSSRTGLKF